MTAEQAKYIIPYSLKGIFFMAEQESNIDALKKLINKSEVSVPPYIKFYKPTIFGPEGEAGFLDSFEVDGQNKPIFQRHPDETISIACIRTAIGKYTPPTLIVIANFFSRSFMLRSSTLPAPHDSSLEQLSELIRARYKSS